MQLLLHFIVNLRSLNPTTSSISYGSSGYTNCGISPVIVFENVEGQGGWGMSEGRIEMTGGGHAAHLQIFELPHQYSRRADQVTRNCLAACDSLQYIYFVWVWA